MTLNKPLPTQQYNQFIFSPFKNCNQIQLTKMTVSYNVIIESKYSFYMALKRFIDMLNDWLGIEYSMVKLMMTDSKQDFLKKDYQSEYN